MRGWHNTGFVGVWIVLGLGGGFDGPAVWGLRMDGFGLWVWISSSFVLVLRLCLLCVAVLFGGFLGVYCGCLGVGFWYFLCVTVLCGVGIIQVL